MTTTMSPEELLGDSKGNQGSSEDKHNVKDVCEQLG